MRIGHRERWGLPRVGAPRIPGHTHRRRGRRSGAHSGGKRAFTELLRTQPKELLLGMSTRWIDGLVFTAYGVFTLTTSVAEEPEAAVEKS